MKGITKKKFTTAYLKNQPSAYTLFIYGFYSTNLRNKNPRPWGSYTAIFGFLVGTVGMVVFDQIGCKGIADKFVLLYSLFVLWGLLTLPAYILNQIRIGRVCGELGINKNEYKMYYDYYIKD